ncbi:MAG: YkgJ family cysteine cluster protein [Phycisphaerales bacterium]|jgi:Fe-S-cluster containining protein|nr:YkgJ family cysteine cluster protein [Phycisphaerales bacterium]
MGECLCDQCSALCCRYFALPIDNPESRRQFDDIRWYLCHENVVIFIEDKQWYIGFMSRCKHLQNDNRCGIYETRPRICREYSTDNCDFHGGEYNFEQLFTSAEQLQAYADEQLAKERKSRRQKSRRRPPPRRLIALKPNLMLPLTSSPPSNGNGRRLSLPQLSK